MSQKNTSSGSTSQQPLTQGMSVFERYLSVWVALCIVVGIALGQWFPAVFHALGAMEVAQVNLPVGVLIWVMIIPMLMKIDFGALNQVKSHWRGIGVTLFVNWLVKPFSMALLGWIFIRHVFAPYLPADQLDSYIAGLILLAAAPCTAMVFVWSRLTNGEPLFTLSQVALNDTIMIFAFAPIVGLLLGLSAITVPWDTLLISVVLYIVIPVILAQILRRSLLKKGQAAFDQAMNRIGHYSILALLLTLVLLFAFQGQAIVAQPLKRPAGLRLGDEPLPQHGRGDQLHHPLALEQVKHHHHRNRGGEGKGFGREKIHAQTSAARSWCSSNCSRGEALLTLKKEMPREAQNSFSRWQ